MPRYPSIIRHDTLPLCSGDRRSGSAGEVELLPKSAPTCSGDTSQVKTMKH